MDQCITKYYQKHCFPHRHSLFGYMQVTQVICATIFFPTFSPQGVNTQRQCPMGVDQYWCDSNTTEL